jgi:dipeptidyl-peptidase-3
MMIKQLFYVLFISVLLVSCNNQQTNNEKDMQDDFEYFLEKFADVKIMRYQVPGFDELTLEQKKLIYYLSEAALCGRDIYFDQLGEYNLFIRSTLENIYSTYNGDKENENFRHFETYLKRVWFSSGIHHHYSRKKFKPAFNAEYFHHLVDRSNADKFPLADGQTIEDLKNFMEQVLFDDTFMPVSKFQDTSKDLLLNSASNFYENVSEQEAIDFYNSKKDENDPTPELYGLNSKLTKKDDELIEKPYKINGLYGPAIEKIVYWLEKALSVTETDVQHDALVKLIEYYKTGNLETWDEYNVLWVKDTASLVDYVNGFIEVYDDPLGIKGYWEAIANFKNLEATKRTEKLSENAQWFENHSPVDDRFKKEEVKGVTAKVITIAQLGGACYPTTPIGINLPNSDWIRRDHGSKSVTLGNITHAYNMVSLKSGTLEEFAIDNEEITFLQKYGPLTDDVHTDLHECLGHGSGQLLKGVSSDALRNYHSTIEETRADLFALYFIADPKMVELGILPDQQAAKAAYISYIRNGLMLQLRRIEPGNDITQAHMRNRQLISKWCYQHGKGNNIIELVEKDGMTFTKINDFEQLRLLIGNLLAEVQRIKSEGDYEAAKNLVETYGVKVDEKLHKEVLVRYEKLDIAPYGGFINPTFDIVKNNQGEINDIKITYENDYSKQMLHYSNNYSFLHDTVRNLTIN